MWLRDSGVGEVKRNPPFMEHGVGFAMLHLPYKC